MDSDQRLKLIKDFHMKYWNNWDMPFPRNQYANWKNYDVNDIHFLLEEITRLNSLVYKNNIRVLFGENREKK